jgi:PTH1 family peptidyl-tRNA hydrolase
VGADAVARLAARHHLALRREPRTQAVAGEVTLDGQRLALAVPETYMNDSGVAVQALVRRFSVAEPGALLVVHDELDLPVGTVRVKRGGGTAGHNGLRSIEAHLRSLDFLRVRIGIGRPPGQMAGADYVLRRPGKADAAELAIAIEVAADAIELCLGSGADAAMNVVNAT